VESYLSIIDSVMGMAPSPTPSKYPFLSILPVTKLESNDLFRIWRRVEHDQIKLIVPKPTPKPFLRDLPYILDLS